MTKLIDYATLGREPLQALYRLERYVRESGLDHKLVSLLKLRASYINGCANCVDMHTKDARAEGESEQRLYAVPVWRDTPFFTPRERAALAYAEAVTNLPARGVDDADIEALREHFSDREILDITFALVAINSWNRLAVSLGADVGSYTVGQYRNAE
jgi:AhpD family alkylhydroperoxidase